MARILVVDDEALVCKTIERALKKAGHKVLSAKTREELLECQKEGPFDLLVLDIHMPDIGPEEVINAMRAENPDLRVLVVTGAMDNFGYPTLSKPFQIEELRQRVRELLNE